MITMRHLWCRVVPDCVCDRGVTSGAVVQLGVISVCNEYTQFQFGSALRQQAWHDVMWFSFGSAVAQLWFRLLWHDVVYGVALVQPWFSLVCPDVSCGSGNLQSDIYQFKLVSLVLHQLVTDPRDPLALPYVILVERMVVGVTGQPCIIIRMVAAGRCWQPSSSMGKRP